MDELFDEGGGSKPSCCLSIEVDDVRLALSNLVFSTDVFLDFEVAFSFQSAHRKKFNHVLTNIKDENNYFILPVGTSILL